MSMLWRIASTAETPVALLDGIHAEIRTVMSAMAAAMRTACHDTQIRMGMSARTMEENLSPIRSSVMPIPPMPTRIPSGMPTMLTASASNSTILRSCFFVAPTEDRRPNCFVRSETEMENAL